MVRPASATPTDRVPAAMLVVAAAISVQSGAAIAVKLFNDIGPLGAVWLRLVLSAAVMVVVARPVLADASRAGVAAAVAFGLVLAAMNTTFYFSIARIPLGAAVTVEFIGPLAVGIAGSRRALDVAWVVLAGSGVLLLASAGDVGNAGARLDPVGLALAAAAGACWSAYIVLSQRVGRQFPGMGGLTVALVVAAIVLAPAALDRHATGLADLAVLGAGLGLAMLSSVVPYSLELAALRRLRAGTFGVLLSLDPAVAALSGWLLLGQHLRWTQWVAIGCVVVASAAASLTSRRASDQPAVADPPEAAAAGDARLRGAAR